MKKWKTECYLEILIVHWQKTEYLKEKLLLQTSWLIIHMTFVKSVKSVSCRKLRCHETMSFE